MATLLSVLIPFRDKPELLNQCLRSLEKFPFRRGSWEILLIDNGSRPGSLAKLQLPPALPIRTLRIDEAFNFQRLNNAGARQSSGRVLLLLNNDIEAMHEGWLEAMYDKACEPTVGAVGCLLLYGDAQTVQHAGVVVGMKRYAEHVYRGSPLEQKNPYFVPPTQNRALSAVTAACLMVERSKWERVNGMDERFIVCGGDVDMCLRLAAAGYENHYLGQVRALHHESQSRGRQRIPVSDFAESERSYGEYLQGRPDPYYPPHLSRDHLIPQPCPLPSGPMDTRHLRAWVRGRHLAQALGHGGVTRLASVACERWRHGFSQRAFLYARPKIFRLQSDALAPARVHYVLPHVLEAATFGGTATILALALDDARRGENVHFILHDAGGSWEALRRSQNISDEEWSKIGHRFSATNAELLDQVDIVVSQRDRFVATAWWTRLTLQNSGIDPARVTYLIQDYEPLFYANTHDKVERLLAQAARESYKQVCHVKINSASLADYLCRHDLANPDRALSWEVFEPRLAPEFQASDVAALPKRKRIFVYARPDVHRNRYDLCLAALRRAAPEIPAQWECVGAGSLRENVDLGHGHTLKALGKLPFPQYVQLLRETALGLTLMESPHPSYPPLELAACGARVVCNRYENKDYHEYGKAFRCVELDAEALAGALIDEIKALSS